MNQPGSHTAPAAPSGALSTALACLALALLALAAYWPSLDYGFLNLDDPIYTLSNPYVRDGFVDGSLRQALDFDYSNWHPLTWLSLMLHAEVFGMTPLGLRIENLALHAGCAALVFLSLRAMTRRFWPSLLVAALFVVHPVNVENVAWIAEHKTLLASFFGFGAVYAHALYVRRPRPWRYVLVSSCALLSLLAKPVFVCLPALLLLLDTWPLGRFAPGRPVLPRLGRLTLEKTPLLLMSAGLCAVYAVIARAAADSAATISYPDMSLRVTNALVSYVRYLDHLARPTGLAFFHPFPASIAAWQTWASALGLAAVTVLALRARSRPWLAVGWLWFLAAMLPTIGILQAGFWPGMAQRYLYLPEVGVFLALAMETVRLADRRPGSKPWVVAACLMVLASLLAATLTELPHWRDRRALAERALEVDENNWFAHHIMGTELLDKALPDLAEAHIRRALELRPDHLPTLNHLARLLVMRHRPGEAAAVYETMLQRDPSDRDALHKMIACLEESGRPDLAEQRLLLRMRAFPGRIAVAQDLADFYLRHERRSQALTVLRLLADRQPRAPSHRNNLGVALFLAGRYAQAEEQFRAALDLKPSWTDARVHLAGALFRQGRLDPAEAEVLRALEADPEHAEGQELLSMIRQARQQP